MARRVLVWLVVAVVAVAIASCAIYAVTQPAATKYSVVGADPQG